MGERTHAIVSAGTYSSSATPDSHSRARKTSFAGTIATHRHFCDTVAGNSLFAIGGGEYFGEP